LTAEAPWLLHEIRPCVDRRRAYACLSARKTSNFQHTEMELVVALARRLIRSSVEDADGRPFSAMRASNMTGAIFQQVARITAVRGILGKDIEGGAVNRHCLSCGKQWARWPATYPSEVNARKQCKTQPWPIMSGACLRLSAHLSQFYHLQAGDVIYDRNPRRGRCSCAGDVIRRPDRRLAAEFIHYARSG